MAQESIEPKRNRFGNIRTSAVWGTIACGAGLFSDGYLNAIIGPVGTILGKIYGDAFTNSPAYSNVRAIAFVGTVVGQLFFGWTSDHVSRKWSLVVSTIILIIFAILATGSYGAHGSLEGMLAALTAYRFFLGIGIGGEYPAGSVGAAEHSGSLRKGSRNRWFIMFTNVQIDLGYVVAFLVAMITVLATTENHLRAAWRICLGIGVIPPLSLLWLRFKISEPEPYKHEAMTVKNTPFKLVVRFYWWRLFLVSAIWFMYDFCSYSFTLYSSDIINNLISVHGGKSKLWITLGWSTLLNFFYMPGCILGAFLADMPRIGPKKTLVGGLILQAIVGYIMSACYRQLSEPNRIGGFVVIYGLFLALGEVGPGDNIGLFASKTSATAIRGKYYGLAAAFGKVGAFVGAYVFPVIAKTGHGNKVVGYQNQFWVGASLAIFSAFLATLLPDISQDVVAEEDLRFRAYLAENGYDTGKLGLQTTEGTNVEAVPVESEKKVDLP